MYYLDIFKANQKLMVKNPLHLLIIEECSVLTF